MSLAHTYTETTTREHDAYKLICGNNRWWPEKRFYRRWQRCFCLARALYTATTPRRTAPRYASVSVWTKLFQDYVKLGRFSDNKTEMRIKSSRFKSHKARGKENKRGKKGLRRQASDFIRGPTECLREIFSSFLLSRGYYLTALYSIAQQYGLYFSNKTSNIRLVSIMLKNVWTDKG